MEERKPTSSFQWFWPFVIKTVIVLLAIGLFLDFVLPDFSEIKASANTELAKFKVKWDKEFRNERTRLYVLSFIQNPAVLYKTSEIAESEGKMDSAVRDMELAIGLLELHSSDKQVLRRYYGRLEKLRAAAKSSK